MFPFWQNDCKPPILLFSSVFLTMPCVTRVLCPGQADIDVCILSIFFLSLILGNLSALSLTSWLIHSFIHYQPLVKRGPPAQAVIPCRLSCSSGCLVVQAGQPYAGRLLGLCSYGGWVAMLLGASARSLAACSSPPLAPSVSCCSHQLCWLVDLLFSWLGFSACRSATFMIYSRHLACIPLLLVSVFP